MILVIVALWQAIPVRAKPKSGVAGFWLILVMIFTALQYLGIASAQENAFDASSAQKTPVRSMGNLHMHTNCSDGSNTYEEMVQMALNLGFSFISITDHRFGGSPLCDLVISQCRKENRLLCIPGMEVTGRVHLLAVGIHKSINARLSVKEQVAKIHEQGGLAIAAHPFREGNTFTEKELFETGLDAIECRGIPFDKKSEFYAKLKKHNIPCVYNSDAHSAIELIIRWNTCEGEIKSLDDLRQALKMKRCGRW